MRGTVRRSVVWNGLLACMYWRAFTTWRQHAMPARHTYAAMAVTANPVTAA